MLDGLLLFFVSFFAWIFAAIVGVGDCHCCWSAGFRAEGGL